MISLLRTITAVSALAFAVTAFAGDIKVKLTGAEEVPPVSSAATGAGTIKVNDDMTVSGSVTTKGIEAVAAHIHSGAVGKNGPPVIPLEQTSPGVWSVPAGRSSPLISTKRLKPASCTSTCIVQRIRTAKFAGS